MSESGARYQRTTPGLVGAMIVTLAVIAAFVAFRALNRNELEVEPESIDYLPAVADIQNGAPFRIAYPPTLPEGWRVTDLRFDNQVGLTWTLDLLTGDDDYMAVRQAEGGIEPLLEEYVDEAAEAGDTVTLHSALADRWDIWTDAQGDYALAARVHGTWLLVFGSADETEVEDFAASLVTDDVR